MDPNEQAQVVSAMIRKVQAKALSYKIHPSVYHNVLLAQIIGNFKSERKEDFLAFMGAKWDYMRPLTVQENDLK